MNRVGCGRLSGGFRIDGYWIETSTLRHDSLFSFVLLGKAERCNAASIAEEQRGACPICNRKGWKPTFNRRDDCSAMLLARTRKNPRLRVSPPHIDSAAVTFSSGAPSHRCDVTGRQAEFSVEPTIEISSCNEAALIYEQHGLSTLNPVDHDSGDCQGSESRQNDAVLPPRKKQGAAD